MGALEPGPFTVEWSADVKEDFELLLLGRFRKIRHALVSRHRPSSDSFMALR